MSSKNAYHHGDLRASILATAMRMLEAGEPLSVRRVGREVGVSHAAFYRHFNGRDALNAALAAQGLRDMLTALSEVPVKPASSEGLSELGVVYVQFALDRPTLFRLMFNAASQRSAPQTPRKTASKKILSSRDEDERAQAAGQVREFLEEVAASAYPSSDPGTRALALWSLAHGLAELHLMGHAPAGSRDVVRGRVHSAFSTIHAASSSG